MHLANSFSGLQSLPKLRGIPFCKLRAGFDCVALHEAQGN
jgi:hypothetical protein